jgi:Holliday junction resolvase RusA-like endonuclease
VEIYVTPPVSWSKKKRTAALDGVIRPTTKPDIDNVIKGIFDAINDIVFLDDKQVVSLLVSKLYAEQARVVVRAYEIFKEN